jgi:hypothetical protein
MLPDMGTVVEQTRKLSTRGGRMIFWAKKACTGGEDTLPLQDRMAELQLSLGGPHELMMFETNRLRSAKYEIFIGVPQRELLAQFPGFIEIQESELPGELIPLVIREDGFNERFPAIAAKRATDRRQQ